MARTIDLELTRAEVEVLELEARLRVVPMNDLQLSEALTLALKAKKNRLDKLKALHAAQNRPQPASVVPPSPPAPGKAPATSNGPAPTTVAKRVRTAKVVAIKAAPKRHPYPRPAPRKAAKAAAKKAPKPVLRRKPATKRTKAKTRK